MVVKLYCSLSSLTQVTEYLNIILYIINRFQIHYALLFSNQLTFLHLLSIQFLYRMSIIQHKSKDNKAAPLHEPPVDNNQFNGQLAPSPFCCPTLGKKRRLSLASSQSSESLLRINIQFCPDCCAAHCSTAAHVNTHCSGRLEAVVGPC